MGTKKLLVDADGVLCDFTTGFLTIANRIAGTNYTHDDVDAWNLEAMPGIKEHSDEIWAQVGYPDFARNLNVYPGAQEGMKALAELGEITIVTAPLWMNNEDEMRGPFDADGNSLYGKTFCYDRMKFLQEKFNIPRKRVIFAYDKSLVEGDVLIDDKLENIRDWIAVHGSKRGRKAILWAQRYNLKGAGCHPKVVRTSDWAETARVIQGRRTIFM